MAWSLNFVKPLKEIREPSPLITQWDDLLAREMALGIQYGQPILLPSSGRPDIDVIKYLNSGSFCRLSIQTQHSYAKDLKQFFSFLDSQQKTWWKASEDDFANYEFWRRRDSQNPARISGAKFARELAAIVRFYKWQIGRGVIDQTPIAVQTRRLRNGNFGESNALAPRNVRRTNVKWLTPRAYRQWRNVGFAGYGIDGLRDEKWRGRMEGRNVAFCDLLWSSGLRLTEGATLLVSEIPERTNNERFVRGRVGEAVAKGGSKRDFWMSADVVDRIYSYIDISRRLAIKRAQLEGRYSYVENILIAKSVTNNRVIHYVTGSGVEGKIQFDQLSAEMRSRIYIEKLGEREPLSLWLGESGMPLPVNTWETNFKIANQRCARNGVDIYCHPHMLRHSFALKMLVTLMHVFEHRMNITADERREFRMIFGDPWTLVQTLLGHRSPIVTRDTYLEPVKGIQLDLILNDTFNDDSSIDDLLSKIAADSAEVEDMQEL